MIHEIHEFTIIMIHDFMICKLLYVLYHIWYIFMFTNTSKSIKLNLNILFLLNVKYGFFYQEK